MAKYDNEFKKEIAELVHNKIKSRSGIKREYGIAPSTVVGWKYEPLKTEKSCPLF